MNVFVPHKKDFNIYFDEIINNSRSNFIFGGLDDYNPKYEIVNIQFPELIFNWKPPTKSQLEVLESNIIIWRDKSKLVYTLNDSKSHYDEKGEFDSLFKLIQKYADGVIHLGNFSLRSFKHLYTKECQHKVIHHPLYTSLLKIDTINIEKEINLKFKDRFIVSVIGNVRSIEEVKFIFKSFRKIPQKNKLLIVPKMFYLLNLPRGFPYRFRKMYWYLIEKYYTFPLKKNQYYYGFNFISYPLMVDLLKKTDLILVPRLKNLNSGILYLGLTFDKPIFIAGIGNTTEIMKHFNLPYLDLVRKNFKKILSKETYNIIIQKLKSLEYLEKKKEFYPEKIAQDYESFFYSLINN